MRIKTITCHDVYNCGASLQAYALMARLEEMGHEVEIIDYKPGYLSGHFSLTAVSPRFDRFLIRRLYQLAKLPGRLRAYPQKKLFDAFTSAYLHLTATRYRSCAELAENPPPADLYLAGSDQIWNPLFRNGHDPAFYLAFAPRGGRRAAYAASFATERVPAAHLPWLHQQLAGLDAIAVRESSSLPLLHRLGFPEAVSVCDPVFLLPEGRWNALAEHAAPLPVNRPYVLVYDFDSSAQVYRTASAIAQRLGAGLAYIGSPCHGAEGVLNHTVRTGPLEFLALIRHASYIVSNSFHATAFALIMGKPFCVIERQEDINARMKSLVCDLGLTQHIVSADTENIPATGISEPAKKRLDTIIAASKDYLTRITHA